MGNIIKKKSEYVAIELVDSNNQNNIVKDNQIEINSIDDNNIDNEIKEESLKKEYETEEELFLKINKIKCFLFYAKIYKCDIFIFIINAISYIIYGFSLESCGFISTNLCTDLRGMTWYYKIVILSLTAGLFQGIFLFIIFIRCKGYFHLIYDIPIIVLFFIIYDGTRVDEHGLYNSMIFIIAILLSTPILTFTFYFFYFIFKRSKISLLFFIFLLMIVIFRYKFSTYDLCENWNKTINSTIDNDSKDYPCKIKIPQKCSLDKLGGIVDISKILRTECHLPGIRKNEKKIFFDSIKYNKYFNNEIIKKNKFGFPITLTPDYEQKWITDNSFATYVNEKTIIMDYYENSKYKWKKYPYELPPEVILTFDEQGYGKITQKINFDKQLSEQRKKISENKKSLFKNIFMFYLDALSHKHFQRKLPKTTKLFKQYFAYNENYDEKQFSAFEFNKYHSIGLFTFENIYAMNYGFDKKTSRKTAEKGISFIKYLKDNGYVTGSAGTICSKDSLFVDEMDLPNIHYEKYDHENVALFCDRNYYDTGYSLINGINSVIHRCLYGKDGYKYAFEYAELFWNSYRDNNKFFRLHLYEAHELTLELIKYADDNIFNFFTNFINKGYLNDTLLLIVSDHGNNFGSFYNLLEGEDKKIEGMLPLFMILIPNKKEIYQSGMYNNLYENQQTFISPYDIYNSIIHASCTAFDEIETKPKNNFDERKIYSWRGYSIFNLINYKERYCFNPSLDIYQKRCVCER